MAFGFVGDTAVKITTGMGNATSFAASTALKGAMLADATSKFADTVGGAGELLTKIPDVHALAAGVALKSAVVAAKPVTEGIQSFSNKTASTFSEISGGDFKGVMQDMQSYMSPASTVTNRNGMPDATPLRKVPSTAAPTAAKGSKPVLG